MKGFFITGTGTDVGKTTFTAAFAAALTDRGYDVGAVKPIETGCNPDPTDAVRLAVACNRPTFAHLDGFYRAPEYLAPYAIGLQDDTRLPDMERIGRTLSQVARETDLLLVEGAGGVLVPLLPQLTVADWMGQLPLPIILVAKNALGTLSHTLTAFESLSTRNLDVACIVLSRHSDSDESKKTNATILQQYVPSAVPIVEFPTLSSSGQKENIRAIEQSGVIAALESRLWNPPAH